MFITLFLKECKGILKSLTYYVFLACTIIFFTSQMADFTGVVKPVKGGGNYGFKYSSNEKDIMQFTLEQLAFDLSNNVFPTYPIGFYKEVTLNEEEKDFVYEAMGEVTGLDKETLKNLIINLKNPNENNLTEYLEIKKGLTFKEFSKSMEKVDDLLGGGSSFSPQHFNRNTIMPMTYEDAVKEYESIINDDKVSRAYARLFSDYMGIILALLPVFLAVTRGVKDKRAKVEGVIFSKKCSSTVIILSRYVAIITMIIIPLLLISISPTMQSIYCANSNGITADYFAFIKVIFGWLLPTILVTVSMGFLITELISGALAILIQGTWWFISMLSATSNLVGNVGFNLIPRFNTVGYYDIYQRILPELIYNRILYSLLGTLLIIVTIFVYDNKRTGRFSCNGKIFKNSSSKLKV